MACLLACGGCKKTRGGKGGLDGRDPNVIADRDSLQMEGLEGMALERWNPGSLGNPIAGDFAPIYFAYDSSRIASEERYKADAALEVLRANNRSLLIVEGHTDERGSREYNLALGERRALAVRAYLIGLGVDGARIQTQSFGEEDPEEMGHDESAYRLNRRAELKLFDQP
jgi:peptidoglycan-associated lipoprotein